jgi:hypothetical protein
MLSRTIMNIGLLAIGILFAQCGQSRTEEETSVLSGTGTQGDSSSTAPVPQREMPERKGITYAIVTKKDSIRKFEGAELEALKFINRCDEASLKAKDSVLVPSEFLTDKIHYSPFPFHIEALKDVKKIVFFSYPAQIFAAYEHGYLVHTGPTNMGRKKDPTPTGLFFANWKAEETRSTFNDEWELKWNFNIQNKEGIGWHQYAMPGYPASHSCLRMLEEDAKTMYEWADQWVLRGTDNVLAQGTPVIVFGAYPFGKRKPWMALAEDAHALDISEEMLTSEVSPHLEKIMAEQQKREKLAK